MEPDRRFEVGTEVRYRWHEKVLTQRIERFLDPEPAHKLPARAQLRPSGRIVALSSLWLPGEPEPPRVVPPLRLDPRDAGVVHRAVYGHRARGRR